MPFGLPPFGSPWPLPIPVPVVMPLCVVPTTAPPPFTAGPDLSGTVAPEPLAPPICADAKVEDIANAVARAIVLKFMIVSLIGCVEINRPCRGRFLGQTAAPTTRLQATIVAPGSVPSTSGSKRAKTAVGSC